MSSKSESASVLPQAAPHARQVIADLALWIGCVVLLQVFRGVLMFEFRDQMASGTSGLQMIRCFANGLRFDISISSYLVLPLAIISMIGFFRPFGRHHPAVRGVLIGVIATVYALAFSADIAYFKEYNNQFDHWVFGLVFDDRQAIALTVWKSYPIVWLGLGIVSLALAIAWGFRRWVEWLHTGLSLPEALTRGWARAITAMMLVGLVVLGLRGSLGRRPIQVKDAAVCGDLLLDKLVMNPFSALRGAIKNHFALSQAKGLEMILPGGDIRAAARALNPQARPDALWDDYVERIATGLPGKKPQHLFLIVMESYDAWSMQPRFQALHLTDGLRELGRSGVMADAFVSAGSGTMPSLAALICGLPEVGLHANYRDSVRTGVTTATAPIFKRLGYRTRFFYAGYPSWQRLGDFCKEQGFDEVHGGAEMSGRLTGNEWGVDDRALFRFILERTREEPTFNVVMTTSYHPPYSVDVEAEGFSMKQLPAELSRFRSTPQQLRELGHLWYSDRCVTEFVRAASQQFPLSAFAVTGDHWSRRCLDPRPTLFERKAVPFVLYGPAILSEVSRPPKIAGAHIDIVPTLVELAAPKGFAYHAFGRNLLDSSHEQAGFGVSTIVTPEYIASVDSPEAPESLQGAALKPDIRVAALREKYRQIHGLAWWRIMRGTRL